MKNKKVSIWWLVLLLGVSIFYIVQYHRALNTAKRGVAVLTECVAQVEKQSFLLQIYSSIYYDNIQQL